MDLSSSIESIARLNLLTEPHGLTIALSQTSHRIELLRKWRINEGDTVLELGCGQGDCTVVLATAVGSTGHVTAIDPGPPDYGKNAPEGVAFEPQCRIGSPFTLQQAQTHILASPVGSRIAFINADPVQYLNDQSENATYDVAVLSHCLWYFSTPETVSQTFRVLSQRVKRVCVAEWSLSASGPEAFPHVLAAMTQASLECRKPISTSNIRTILSPDGIKAIVTSVGALEQESESYIKPSLKLDDGRWEVSAVQSKDFLEEIRSCVRDERERAVVIALRDSLLSALAQLPEGRESVRAMNVWVASFIVR